MYTFRSWFRDQGLIDPNHGDSGSRNVGFSFITAANSGRFRYVYLLWTGRTSVSAVRSCKGHGGLRHEKEYVLTPHLARFEVQKAVRWPVRYR